MTKRPEALLLAVGAIALIIAGVLVCTHQTVPAWDITVIIATLVGGGVATVPTGETGALTSTISSAITEILTSHRNAVAHLLGETTGNVTPVTNSTPPRSADPVTSVTTPVTSVTNTPPGTQSADPTAGEGPAS